MDMQNNRIPGNVKNIHLMAVCGTGMGALASLLKESGYTVTGSDQQIYPPMSDFLVAKGIAVMNGFRPENLAHGPDLVVVGNAVTRQNPEAMALEQSDIAFCSMPQAINHFLARGKQTLVVTGTHGKTTTSALLAWILHAAGYDPSFVIGGILGNFDSNYRFGNGHHVVLEGDEYDTAFFDKGPKFRHYDPDAAILTSVEFDHADIFRDFDHVRDTFAGFISGLRPESLLAAFDQDETVRALAAGCPAKVETYGPAPSSDWRLGRAAFKPGLTDFEIFRRERLFGTFQTPLMGRHNLFNTLAAVAVAHRIGIGPAAIAEALASFKGIRRRQEIRGRKNGITVMDDFAHHPTAVRETLKAVKPFCAGGRLVAVFEPRTNTSMRSVFQEEYAGVFGPADLICIRKPPLLEKVPPGQRFDSHKLVQDLKGRGHDAHYFEITEAIIEFLAGHARRGDVILIMSNGGFEGIHGRLLNAL